MLGGVGGNYKKKNEVGLILETIMFPSNMAFGGRVHKAWANNHTRGPIHVPRVG
jgi:hypothetical protein